MRDFFVQRDSLLLADKLSIRFSEVVTGYPAGQMISVNRVARPVPVDPLWTDVALLIQAPETGSTIADAKGKTVTVQGNTAVSTALGYPTIYFDGSGDRLEVGAAGDFNFLHNGSKWTLEFLFRPASVEAGHVIIDTTRGTTVNRGLYLGFSSGKLRLFITRGVSDSYVINSTLNHTFSANVEVPVCLEYDHALATGTLKMYVNGTLVASANKTSNTPSTGNCMQMMVGMFSTSSGSYSGHMRSLRLTSGIRYGAAHTPPDWPLPTS